MASLIITIISIVLVAIAAIMAIYYGGIAYQQAQINALATQIVAEAQQTLAAQRLWASNNNQPDATNANYLTLVNTKTLSSMPFGAVAQLGLIKSFLNVGAINGFLDINSYPMQCVNYYGAGAAFIQEPFTYNNGNYVLYGFYNVAFCLGIAVATSSATNPLGLLAKAINANSTVPANTVLSTNGIPRQAAGATLITHSSPGAWFSGFAGKSDNFIMIDSNGILQSNYCYYPYTTTTGYNYLTCVFGPS